MDGGPYVPTLRSCPPLSSPFVKNSVVLFNDWISALAQLHLSDPSPSSSTSTLCPELGGFMDDDPSAVTLLSQPPSPCPFVDMDRSSMSFNDQTSVPCSLLLSSTSPSTHPSRFH
jgi:hypothetical protein